MINNKHPTWLLKFLTGNFSSILSKMPERNYLISFHVLCSRTLGSVRVTVLGVRYHVFKTRWKMYITLAFNIIKWNQWYFDLRRWYTLLVISFAALLSRVFGDLCGKVAKLKTREWHSSPNLNTIIEKMIHVLKYVSKNAKIVNSSYFVSSDVKWR